jgi:hypothetical protein
MMVSLVDELVAVIHVGVDDPADCNSWPEVPAAVYPSVDELAPKTTPPNVGVLTIPVPPLPTDNVPALILSAFNDVILEPLMVGDPLQLGVVPPIRT